MAERGGFEPPVEFNPYNCLAGSCLQPLGHLSIKSKTGYHSYTAYCRKKRSYLLPRLPLIIKPCLCPLPASPNKGLAIVAPSFYKITMTTDIKICPECGAEFYSHISECNGCDVPLIHPDATPVTTGVPQVPDSDEALRLVTIEQGDLAKISELHNVLTVRGLPSEVINATAAAGSCNGGFLLQVPEYIKKTAVTAINDHWHELHPELGDAVEREESGQCPACGFTLDSTPENCPDCGLNLGSPADDDKGDDGCSDPSGSCGPC